MTKLGNIIEAVDRAHHDCRVDVDPSARYVIGGILAAGNVTFDELIGVVMRTHRRIDPVTQCRLVARILARLAEPTSRSAPQRRPAAELSHSRRPVDGEMLFTAPYHGIVSVNGRSRTNRD